MANIYSREVAVATICVGSIPAKSFSLSKATHHSSTRQRRQWRMQPTQKPHFARATGPIPQEEASAQEILKARYNR